MTAKRSPEITLVAVFLVAVGWPVPTNRACGHCDTMEGPVVKTAQKALEKGDVMGVLKWVKPEHEARIREAFHKTVAVRTLSKKAKDLADQYFFETLVRLHREGEGAPYTGLKPAGAVELAVAASDKALEVGSVESLAQQISQLVAEGIRHRFAETMEKKRRADENVTAGRDFVRAYVQFVHYVERLHADATGRTGPHPRTEAPDEHNSHQR